MRFRKISIEIIVAILILVFIYTGLNKILDYSKFEFTLGRSPFIQNMAGFIAKTLPTGEIILAFSLVFKRTRLIGLYASFFLMLLFTGYIWLMLNYAYDLPCSCGGVLAALSWPNHLIFNIILTILAFIGIVLQSKISDSFSSPKQMILKTGG